MKIMMINSMIIIMIMISQRIDPKLVEPGFEFGVVDVVDVVGGPDITDTVLSPPLVT